MSAPPQLPRPVLGAAQPGSGALRTRGPMTFLDDASLLRQLDRRGEDRRSRDRRDAAPPATNPHLGVRELCHDLRQPLSSAVVLVHMLEKEMAPAANGRQRLELLRAELGRLSDMLTAQIEPAPPVLVDLAALVYGVCGRPGEPAAVPVEVLLGQAPLVLGDPVQLSRLVENLVTNARAAAGPEGAVRVLVDAVPGAARIAVEDSGSASDTAPGSGFGLGLMIVDSVVRRHRGTSTCSASSLGGLRVTVTVPVDPSAEAGEVTGA